MNIKTYDKTIKDLFISGHLFEIPRFQREYSWDKKNYEEFFLDMLNNLTLKDGQLNNSSYFLGTMLFIGNFTENIDRVIKVVDGQQRITTITILFSALASIFRDAGQEGLSEAIFRYVMSKDDNGDDVRILKSNSSYPFFSFYIQDRLKENAQEPTTEEEICIKETYEYFSTQLQEKQLKALLLKRFGEDDVNNLQYVDILKSIRDQVLGCTFITISTNDESQANRIFEILNAKGKRLAHIDLIKNRLFEMLPETEPADFAECKWNEIKQICNNANVGIGTFYRHFFASTYKKTASNKLYDDFKAVLKQDKKKHKDFLVDMLEGAKRYAKIINSQRGDYEDKKEYFWLVQSLKVLTDDFGITQVRVALMSLLWAKENTLIGMSELRKSIIYLENFHFAYNALMAGRTNKLESIYSKFALALRKCANKADARMIIENMLISPLEKLFPSFEQFCSKFILLQYTKKNMAANVKCKYVLRKINCYYQNSEIFDVNESVEHILPECQDDRSLGIGNLIALEIVLNNEAADKAYADKLDIYKKSKYNWLKEFIEGHPVWDFNDLDTRANYLAELYYTKILGRAKA